MSGAFVETLKMIKIEHSIFALPFALIAAFWAAGGMPEPGLVSDGNLDKVNAAFFTINGMVSLLFGPTTITAILIS